MTTFDKVFCAACYTLAAVVIAAVAVASWGIQK